MNLNLKFFNKMPKQGKDNEIIFLNNEIIKIRYFKPLSKTVFSSKLFTQKNFLKKEYNNKSYIFVNCLNSKTSLDFEKQGSKLFTFLKENKIEEAVIDKNNNPITTIQLEKILHLAILMLLILKFFVQQK